jgi:SAM-dependent methyltransferase
MPSIVPLDRYHRFNVKLYTSLAEYWPILSAPEDYAEEAGFYWRVMSEARPGPIDTLLELGAGGGNNASHLKAHAQLTLVDNSAGMLAHSRRLNPECEHLPGDIRDVRLDRQFDAVFVHDAVCYMTTIEDLRRAMDTAFLHCRPGGVVLFCPDFVRETFRGGTDHGGHDNGDAGFRYLEWTWDPDPEDSTYVADYVFAIRSADGAVRIEHDRHVEGLFSRHTWLDQLAAAGFSTPRSVPLEHSEVEPGVHEVFVATRQDT